jgi:hypothetical protein
MMEPFVALQACYVTIILMQLRIICWLLERD